MASFISWGVVAASASRICASRFLGALSRSLNRSSAAGRREPVMMLSSDRRRMASQAGRVDPDGFFHVSLGLGDVTRLNLGQSQEIVGLSVLRASFYDRLEVLDGFGGFSLHEVGTPSQQEALGVGGVLLEHRVKGFECHRLSGFRSERDWRGGTRPAETRELSPACLENLPGLVRLSRVQVKVGEFYLRWRASRRQVRGGLILLFAPLRSFLIMACRRGPGGPPAHWLRRKARP